MVSSSEEWRSGPWLIVPAGKMETNAQLKNSRKGLQSLSGGRVYRIPGGGTSLFATLRKTELSAPNYEAVGEQDEVSTRKDF